MSQFCSDTVVMSLDDPDFQLFSSLRYDPILVSCGANTVLDKSASPFYMLPFHRDRILQAAEYFNWPSAIKELSGSGGLEVFRRQLELAIDTTSNTPLRVRTVVDHVGNIKVETNQTLPVSLRNLFPTRIPPPGSAEVRVSPLTGGVLTLGPKDTVEKPPGYGDPDQIEAWVVMVDPSRTEPSPFTTYKTTCRDMYTEARVRAGIATMTEPQEVFIISTKDDEIMEGSLTSVFFWRNGRWVTPPVASGGQAGTTRRWLLEKGLCDEEAVTISSLKDGEECWISNGVRGLTWCKVRL